jgi:SAM-dependent methyltransferase
VGVGGPAVARWLSARVGSTGRVLATDIDIRWVREPIADNVTVRRHDVAGDTPPHESFDLVHERLVLIHVPERARAVENMAATLRSGGWILVEDFDSALQPFACPDAPTPAHELANKLRAGFRALLEARGADLAWGRRLPRSLRDAGLVDVGADAYVPIARPEARALERANVEQVRNDLIDGGLATAGEIDQHLAALDAGTIDVATGLLVSAWGRKP